jgi:hypothetical protein
VTATTPKRPGGAGQAHTTRDGRASEAQVPTAAPRSCVSRRSPAAACRLAPTDRYTLKKPIHHASGVGGRDWAGGARFGALRERHRAYLYKNLAKIADMKDTRILRVL